MDKWDKIGGGERKLKIEKIGIGAKKEKHWKIR